jgi:3-hydroxybutyryl-CoA dehydrogenase
MVETVRRVAVIGAGTMGAGIAQVSAMAGWWTVLSDVRAEALPAAREIIAAQLAGAVDRGKLTPELREATLERLTTAGTVADACTGVDLVIEAVVEDLNVKRAVMATAAPVVADGAILASNTSSLSLATIAEGLPHPGQCLGLHFFNPVHIMKLVEIVVHDGVNDETRAKAVAIVEAMGKEPIVVKDSPGFASSRLGIVLGMEAIRMVEDGVASPVDIDKAMELGYKHPMGPLKLTDLVGLDVRLKIAEYLHATLGGDHFKPPQLLRDMVDEGKLGKKSGHGFYDWA